MNRNHSPRIAVFGSGDPLAQCPNTNLVETHRFTVCPAGGYCNCRNRVGLAVAAAANPGITQDFAESAERNVSRRADGQVLAWLERLIRFRIEDQPGVAPDSVRDDTEVEFHVSERESQLAMALMEESLAMHSFSALHPMVFNYAQCPHNRENS